MIKVAALDHRVTRTDGDGRGVVEAAITVSEANLECAGHGAVKEHVAEAVAVEVGLHYGVEGAVGGIDVVGLNGWRHRPAP